MLRVLGQVEADGDVAPVSRAHRVLLAALALDRPGAVGGDRLVDLLWPASGPGNPTAALHNHVSRLRRTLPPDVQVVAAGDGYRLLVPDDLLDVCRFEQAVGLVGHVGPADPAAGLAHADAALSLWRGTPYADLVDDDRAHAEAVRLTGLRLALQDARTCCLVDLGRAPEAVADLESRLALDPLRERTVELLMRAYVAAGRRADALLAYRQLRARTVEELGLDPSPQLRRLETEVAGDRVPVPAPRGGITGTEARSVVLPASGLVGREADAVAARRTLRGHRLLTVVGPGGVGKTRLALHLAHEVQVDVGAGTTTVVELAQLREADGVADLLASTLQAAHGAGSALDRVLTALSTGRHLLLLDNCEHLVEAAARLVDTVLRRTDGVTVVATSREPLGVDGERVLRLDPLALPPAVELFVDRAVAADAGFVLDDADRQAVEQLCRSLDCLPLALELAAARTATSSVREVLAAVDDRPLLLDGGRRTAGPRHRSLRSLVEWSVRDLDPWSRRLFARLSVFAAPVAVADAADVVDEPEHLVADAAARLAERSLLVAHRGGGPTRYGFLQTVRSYAVDLLAASGEAADVGRRHATWAVGVVAAAERGTTATDPTGGSLDRLAELRVAHRFLLATGDADGALRLAAGLHHVAMFRMQAEVFGWVTETAARFGAEDHPDAERVLASACIGAWQSGDLGAARALAERAVAAGARADRPGAGAGGAEATADVALFEGDLETSLQQWRLAVDRVRALGPTSRLVTDLADLAIVLSYLHHHEPARQAVAEARRLLDPEPSWVTAWVDYAEGETLAEVDPARALAVLGRALDTARATAADFVTGVAGLTWVGLQVREGQPAAAVPFLGELLRRWRRGGAWVQLWITLRTVVEAFVALDDLEPAAVVLGAVEAARATGSVAGPDQERLALLRAALTARLPDAEQRFAQGAATSRDDLVELVLARLSDRAVEGSTAG